MNPRMHPRGRPRATARDLRSHSVNDQIVIQSILTHEFDAPALRCIVPGLLNSEKRGPSADSDLMRYELTLIRITLRWPHTHTVG